MVRSSRASMVAAALVLAGVARAPAQEPSSRHAGLRDALAFAATFDDGLDADVARGDARLHHGPTWGPPRTGEPGLVRSGAVTRERRGALRGHALRFHRRTDELLFFHGEGNAPWRARDWSGTLAFWLRAELASELPPGLCSPIVVTSKDWNDAGLSCQFEQRAGGRVFGLGAFPDAAVWLPDDEPWDTLADGKLPAASVDASEHFGGRWTHVAVAFERFNTGAPDGVARLYLDGALAATLSPRTQTWSWIAADARIMLGPGYAGWIDEIAWFERALSDAEIAALHALPGGLSDLWRPRVPAGAAKVDVTPDFPIRLCGYAARDVEATSAVQPLFARALAIGEGESLAVIVALDNTAVPQRLTDEVARRLQAKCGLAPQRFTLAVTHTHCAPVLDGGIDCMFGRPIPADQWSRIERYTRLVTDRIEAAALQAIAARAPALVSWGEGEVDFARNRRTAGGPVDRALPLLAVLGDDGAVRATLQSCACHCTALNHEINAHCGDWAGYASQGVEAAHAGAVSLTIIGCGADANPAGGPTRELAVAQRHGASVAAEVERLLRAPLTPLLRAGGGPDVALARLELPYAPLPPREEWQRRVAAGGAVGFHAQQWLARLERGESLPAALPYSVQAWRWDDDLLQLYLPGEVVVDYALRLRRELDRARLWVSAYCNDVPCYVPSERILREGGYEAGGAMTYYGRPGPLASGVEQLVIDAAHAVAPAAFAAPPDDPRFPAPKSPEESRGCFVLSRDELEVELAACEPAIASPVAIDFAADGALYVCEMVDYPSGMQGGFEPGGRVTVLRDRDGDGRCEESVRFLEGLAFPTGVMAWRRGALVCAAPDVLYAEDTDGDGRADVRRVLFTGFSTENYQARVNSLTFGLDGWVYGSCGLYGGVITGFVHDPATPGAAPRALPPVDCRGRDFRLDPERGVIEAIEGTSQQGRVRDDFGRWFGCDSGWLVFQFPIADRYLRRNPHVAPPNPRWNVLLDDDPGRLFQISPALERFNDFAAASRVTSACGIGIYRDEWLGRELYGDAFTCEPVANVVRRTVLDASGSAVTGRRAPEEATREFLASRDPWFRPVQAATGPDGALWIVDMYRFVIEHPRWIPAAKLAELDVRAGADKGRLWRVVRKGAERRRVEDLAVAGMEELREALASSNGVVRDLAHRELLAHATRRAPRSATELIESGTDASGVDAIARRQQAVEPSAIVQEAWCLAQLGWLDEDDVTGLLALNQLPEVRASVMELAEPWLAHRAPEEDPGGGWGGAIAPPHPVTEWSVWVPAKWRELDEQLGAASGGVGRRSSVEPTGRERLQSALVLGECPGRFAGTLLGELLVWHPEDPWVNAAVLSAAPRHAQALLEALLGVESRSAGQEQALDAVVTTAAALASAERDSRFQLLDLLVGRDRDAFAQPARWRRVARLLGAIRRDGAPIPDQPAHDGRDAGSAAVRDGVPRDLLERLRELRRAAHTALSSEPASVDSAVPALELVFPAARTGVDDAGPDPAAMKLAAGFLSPTQPAELGLAALEAYRRVADPRAPGFVLESVPAMLPQLRAAAFALLLSRAEWREGLVAALEGGRVAASLLDGSAREQLLRLEDAALRERAARLLAPAGTPARAEVLARLQPALGRTGELAHGKELFARLCASCHAFRGAGHDVGPDLAALGDRSAARLLEAIVDPNAAVNGEFASYQVVLRDGSDLVGLIRGESSGGFTLVQANGLSRAVLRSDVAEVRSSRRSLMPEGLEEGLSVQEVADVIAWSRSGPLALGSVTAEQIAAARAELAAAPLNGFARLLERYDDFAQPSWLGVVPMRYCRQLDGAGVVRWRTGPAEAVPGDPTRVRLRFAGAVGYLSQPAGDFALTLEERELLRFDVVVGDARWRSDDGAVELDFECRAANREDATGLFTLTLPASTLAPGAATTLTVTGAPASSHRWFGLLTY